MVSFHLIWKNYVLNWDFDLKSWIVDFFTRFTHEKTPHFSRQNVSVENNYFINIMIFFYVEKTRAKSCFLLQPRVQITRYVLYYLYLHCTDDLWSFSLSDKNTQFFLSSQYFSIKRIFYICITFYTEILSHLLFHSWKRPQINFSCRK